MRRLAILLVDRRGGAGRAAFVVGQAGGLGAGRAGHVGHRGRRRAHPVAGRDRRAAGTAGAMVGRRRRSLSAGGQGAAPRWCWCRGPPSLGRDEPRLKALARTFARAGFAVLVPELPEVRRLALSRADADRVAAALRYLGGRSRACRSAWPPSPMPWRRPSSRCSRTTSRRASASSSASAATATPNPSSASSPPARFVRAATAASSGVEPSG